MRRDDIVMVFSTSDGANGVRLGGGALPSDTNIKNGWVDGKEPQIYPESANIINKDERTSILCYRVGFVSR